MRGLNKELEKKHLLFQHSTLLRFKTNYCDTFLRMCLYPYMLSIVDAVTGAIDKKLKVKKDTLFILYYVIIIDSVLM